MYIPPKFKATVKNKIAGRALIKAFRVTRGLLRSVKVWFALKVLRVMSSNISLTYDPNRKPDGVGAQLQRVFAINGLCKITKIRYTHTEISDVAIHALDPYQTTIDYQNFISLLNSTFKMRGAEFSKVRKEISVEHFRARTLIYYSLLSILKREYFLLRVSEPYELTDSISNTYSYIHPLEDNLRNYLNGFKMKSPTIAIHYRWGVGGKQIQKGESITRELDFKYYLKVVENIKSLYSNVNYKLVIVTDAPGKSLVYEPPKEQKSLWVGSPGFSQDKNTIEVSGIDMHELFSGLGMEIEIISGGNPLDAIAILANSEHLVMSRSSLSFVAALLSKTEVYFPASFWHRPLRNWHLVNDQDLISK